MTKEDQHHWRRVPRSLVDEAHAALADRARILGRNDLLGADSKTGRPGLLDHAGFEDDIALRCTDMLTAAYQLTCDDARQWEALPPAVRRWAALAEAANAACWRVPLPVRLREVGRAARHRLLSWVHGAPDRG